jgi:alkylation response protein AidB-like acyl-CoA dehydrogenase
VRFEPSAEQSQIREMVRSLARRELAPRAGEIDDSGRYPEENMRRLAALGLLGMLLPGRYGGSGAGAVAYSLALSEVAYGCASTAVGMAVTSMVGEAIWRFGTEEQRARHLPGLAEGKSGGGAFALTEPGAGSDASGIGASAVRDGNGYVLNGNKAFITNGARAAVTIVMAVTEKSPRKQISAFLVEKGTRGVSAGKGERKMGLKGSETVAISLEDCRVPASCMLGTPGEGFRIAMSALDGGRIGIASQALGIARAAVEAAGEYVKDRRQFDRPVSEFQAIRWMLADCATELEAAELLTLRAAYLKDAGKPFRREASMAKLFATEAGNRACHKAVQMLGGYGCIREYPVERHLRDIRVATIYEGTSEIQRIVLSRSLLERENG